MRHVPVLLQEVIDALQLKPGIHAIDCTVGDGGHAEQILEATGPKGKLLAIDADPESLLRAKQYLYRFGDRVTCIRENFSELRAIVDEHPIGAIAAMLIDLGWSSPQFEERGRGFSFKMDEPLDMRYAGGNQTATAAELVNTLSVAELERIFNEYGEEHLSREIAEAISQKRKETPITRTGQLVEIILATYRKKLNTDKEIPWIGGLHPATKVFQALRIAVNDELGVLERVLPQALSVLAPGGRLAVISFHSLEDRIVKHFFQKQTLHGFSLFNKKPIICSSVEYEQNTRARSAKLRVIEKNIVSI